MAQTRQKIIEELKKSGLLEKNKLKELPQIPLKIGLITAYGSAAYHDFTNELSTSGYAFKVLIFDCHMQGNLTEGDVLAALSFFNRLSSDQLDVIVITRGGGSTADLSYFDSKKIAETIADSKFAVISAIGHQINTTITDMASHTFCKTPTKAAQLLTERLKTAEDDLNYLQDNIFVKAKDYIANVKKELQALTVKTETLSSRYFRLHQEEVLELKHKISAVLRVFLAKERQLVKQAIAALGPVLVKLFKSSKNSLQYIEEKIRILDPENTLKRGYSITFKEGKAIKSIDEVSEEDLIKTVLYKGSIISKVRKKEKNYE
jgi:exodeoxyribonuclease VII large subunit